MEYVAIATVAAVIVGYGLVSRRLATTPLTGPIVFVGVGVLIGPSALDLADVSFDRGAVRILAEATLILLLFTDAARIDLATLRRYFSLPGRLLGIGLPLTLAAGTLAAILVFPRLGVWEAALLAAILTPTDAALGKAVVTSRLIPVRVRQTINVESGLNDGLMLPIITALVAVVAVGVDLETPAYWLRFVATQVGFGVLAGAAVGYVGGRLLDHFASRGWVQGAMRQLATLSIAVAAFALASAVDGNGFVAAFVAGIAFGAAAREQCPGAYDFAEDEGQLFALLTFLFFGAALAGPALDDLNWRIALYVVLSLTVVRMLPVALSLAGSRLRLPTVAFVGWFGPRGLASILFGLFILEEAEVAVFEEVLMVVTWTVMVSVVLHGATSYPLANRYGRWVDAHPQRPVMGEMEAMPEMPTRG